MSALVVGLDLIMKYCRHLKFIKNVIMITDGRGSTDWSQSDEIAEQIKKESINVSILYILPALSFWAPNSPQNRS